MTVKCPMCGKTALWEGNVYKPFCSERCQLLDLEGWFSERYRIPDAEDDEPDDKPNDAQPPSSENGTL